VKTDKITLTLKIADRYGTVDERELEQVEFETDEAFFERAKRLLAQMREES
jgi:hypothetical protein